MGIQPTLDVDREGDRRALRLAKRASASTSTPPNETNPQDYGSITQLRELLGFAPPHTIKEADATAALPQDALIVSLDVEWERQGLKDYVVEIGLTILDTRDIINIAPGSFGDDWFSKTKTYHYVASVTQRRAERMHACYFSKDMFFKYSTIKTDIESVLRRAANPPGDQRPIGRGPRKVVLVGHSVVRDLHSLYESPGLALDFLGTDVFLMKPTTVFDTFMLAVAAKKQGAKIRERGLGFLVNWLGVHRRYQLYNSVKGCHNAGNDAAYTMMALLMYAIRWEKIVSGKREPRHEKSKPQRELPSRSHESTLEGLRSKLDDSTLEDNTSVISEGNVELMTLPLQIPSASAEPELEHVTLKPLSSSSRSVSAKTEQKHVKRKKVSLPAPSVSAEAEPISQPVSAEWGSSLQKLTGWWRQP